MTATGLISPRSSSRRVLTTTYLLVCAYSIQAFHPLLHTSCSSTSTFSCPAQRLLPLNVLSAPRAVKQRKSSSSSASSARAVPTTYLINNPKELEEQTQALLQAEESLPPSVLSDSIPILYAWAKRESSSGAKKAQSVLDRLRQDKQKHLLTAKHYTIVMDAWSKMGKAERAEAVYQSLVQDIQVVATDPAVAAAALTPNRVTWNVLVSANIRANNLPRAEQWLSHMEKQQRTEDRAPQTADYNLLLQAYARQGLAQSAEQLIKRMVDRCKEHEDDCICQPDLQSYNTLLEAHAKSGEAGIGQRALDIMQVLKKSKSPDARTFAAVILALSLDPGVKDAAQQAKQLYEQAKEQLYSGTKMDEASKEDWVKLQLAFLDASAEHACKDDACAANAEKLLSEMEDNLAASPLAYNKVLKAWKIANSPESIPRSLAILKRMEQRKLTDRISYSTVIGCLANRGDKTSAQKANEILDDMIRLYEEEGKEECRPNTQTLNGAILAWARCGNPQRAEHILDQMEQNFLADNSSPLAPTVVTYSTVMDGWAKSGHKESVLKTEQVFERMQQMYQEHGNEQARPNLVSYVTLINALANARDPKSAQRAEDTLFHMYEEYKKGDNALKPNTQTISAVIEAWQKSGRRDAGERAEAVLDWMISLYEDQKDEYVCPNEYSFSSTISAWSKSRRIGKPLRARKVLNRMLDLYKSGVLSACPNAHCYTAVINSCAYCENDEIEKKEALRIAISTFKELAKSNYAVPNHITFATLLTALRNLMPHCDERDSAVETIFKAAAKGGYVDKLVVRRMESVLTMDKLHDIFSSAAMKGDGTVRFEQLPTEWRRKVIQPSKSRRSQLSSRTLP